MLSIIITSYKEPLTIRKAVDSFLKQDIREKYEIIVLAPDKETAEVVKKAYKNNKKVIYIKDPLKGKPTALNIAFKKARGQILILSDGDVYTSENSVNYLVKHFKNKKVGAVSGRPISLNEKTNILGYWSHLLTDIGAHETRLLWTKKNKFIVCSGYLMTIRKGIINSIPENSLADDAVISHLIYGKGYKIEYEPNAKVYVKYPTTFKDWIKQKKRSAGGYNQLKNLIQNKETMRSFTRESIEVFRALRYPKNIKEFIWTIALIIARLYLWILIFIEINIKKEKFENIWTRVESTK
ncbi:glycosyltransferase [Candidatus Woesearchaeota archaeon]|nr:glycosyltransferase [Candidatus Woesearchaeota archaeon]